MGFRALEFVVQGEKEEVVFHNIPFQVFKRDGKVMPMPYDQPVRVDEKMAGLFFLGMTTQVSSGECGWTGERYYGYERKLFIGDIIGRIDILYENNLMDAIPLIFGVNVWNYETFSFIKDHEGPVFPIKSPYREPFDSEKGARNLLWSSLVLHENDDGEKYTKYVFAFYTRNRKLKCLWVKPWGSRDAGIGISAITAFTSRAVIPNKTQWKFTTHQFYVKRVYYASMDRLARRLYQYLDEIPKHFPLDKPPGYRGPYIALKGTPEAELLTNVYYHNIHDMMTNKVEKNGRLHTSTKRFPCYGFYAGIGTYRIKGQYNYYEQIWSRDTGRMLCEIIEHEEIERCSMAAEVLFNYLSDEDLLFKKPHWKRIVNASELGIFPESYDGITFQEFIKGKENDGHASLMLMIYRLYHHRCVGLKWLKGHLTYLVDVAEWFCWQMDHPEESDFNEVLCSESEATYGSHGGYDLFSNSYVYFALIAFSFLAHELGKKDLEKRWKEYAERLRIGMEKTFITTHPRYGKVLCEPESDNWPSELKRMASLLLMPELFGYDPAENAPQYMDLWINTLKAQKEVFFSPMVGGSMGYGQGYTTQIVLLLDEVENFTQCLNWAARFCYHHTEYPYIVPEGVTYHPTGRFWYRHTDLGNAVQQAEIVKCIRLILGFDDLNHKIGLRLIPRLPDGWQQIEVRKYSVVTLSEGKVSRVFVNFQYKRLAEGFEVFFNSERAVRIFSVRVGPFPMGTKDIKVEGIKACATLKRRGSRSFAYIPFDQDMKEFRIRVIKI